MTERLLAQHSLDMEVAFGAGGSRTAGDLLKDVATLIGHLPKENGGRALLCFQSDRYAFCVALLAAWAADIPVTLPPNLRGETIAALLAQPGVSVLMHDTAVAGHLSVPEVLKGPSARPLPRAPHPRGPIVRVLTSGTMGKSDAWDKTLEQLLDEIEAWLGILEVRKPVRVVATVPPAHLYGLLFSVLLPLTSGGSFCRETPLLPEAVATRVSEYEAQMLVTVPVHLRAAEVVDRERFGSLRWVLSSTAPLHEATAKAFSERHGRAVTEIFGSTETGGIAWRRRGRHEHWQPLPQLRVSVTHDERLVVDSPFASLGLPRPYETADRIELHEDGSFVSLGRRDNVAKVGGLRVNLEGMEELLLQNVGVLDAAIIGAPDAHRGTRVLAAVVAPHSTEAALRQWLSEHFHPSTLPQRFLFLHRLPREVSGKLRRQDALRLFGLDDQGRPLSRSVVRVDPATNAQSDAERVSAEFRVPDDYIYYAGHFDTYPVMAGAVQLHELLLPLIYQHRPDAGHLQSLHRIKFTGRISPGDLVRVQLEFLESSPELQCAFSCFIGERSVSAGRLSFARELGARPVEEGKTSHDLVKQDNQHRYCFLIPTYDNPRTLRSVVEEGRKYLHDVIVVDDGSGSEGRGVCERLAHDGLAIVHHQARNGGKGAAVKAGLELARRLGFTHVLQADADGQHDLTAAPRFLEISRQKPSALVLGYPQYDESAPKLRQSARKLTNFWVDFEVGKGVVRDAMIGFRVYPLEPLEGLAVRGNRMDFDIEVVVRAAWAGVAIENAPVPVRYLEKEEGGVSHFRPLRDNLSFSWMHSKLCTERCIRVVMGWMLSPLALLKRNFENDRLPPASPKLPEKTR